MGSLESDKTLYGTFKFAVDIPVEPYDPWQLPYFKAPEGVYAKTVERTYPLVDFRDDVLDGNYTTARSRDFLRKTGFTAINHHTALHSPPYGQLADFQNVQLINEVYYPEVEKLVKDVTGCSKVIITDSLIRGATTDPYKNLSDSSWEKADTVRKLDEIEKKSGSAQLHKPEPSLPTRLPHWDWTPLGARQMIRKWSEEIVDHAAKAGIIKAEDAVCYPASAMDEKNDGLIHERYDGPRYATFSVWRPLKKITRDPLAMAPYQGVDGDPDLVAVPHQIKQPGTDGDWLRELATLKVTEQAASTPTENAPSNLQWHYISNQNTDEVLIVKSFDSAGLMNQAKVTGEARGAPHASPDLGEMSKGGARESIEVRLLAFW